ncbi:hypothetical protein BYT27DRAFT_6870275 [Phlegmacium glaucopus]|nr:hypothetical protein BYT27DRAFT_6870275 [Phlegmacium glaucopus]
MTFPEITHSGTLQDPGPFSFLPVAISVPSSKTTAPGVYALPFILLPIAGPKEFDLGVSTFFPV